jgi:hypothetical protein
MTARDDYPLTDGHYHRQWQAMCAKIDKLTLRLAWTENIAEGRSEENERLRGRVRDLIVERDALIAAATGGEPWEQSGV